MTNSRYVEPAICPEDVLHASSLRQLELLSRKSQFLNEEETKPPREWSVASISVVNTPDWMENVNVSIVNLYGEKSLVLERQNLLRNQRSMGASVSWKEDGAPKVKGEVVVEAREFVLVL